MRYLALAAALLFTLTVSSPAQAGAALPRLATVMLGDHEVRILNDSPFLQTGRNTLTVELYGLPENHQVKVTLAGPAGEQIRVPLQKVHVLAGVAGGHGDGGHGNGGHGDDHGGGQVVTTKGEHGTSVSGGHDDDEDLSAEEMYLSRGRVVVKSVGEWTLLVEITDDHGDSLSGHVVIEAVPGGPNRIAVGLSGLLMGGTFLYGFMKRRTVGSVREVTNRGY